MIPSASTSFLTTPPISVRTTTMFYVRGSFTHDIELVTDAICRGSSGHHVLVWYRIFLLNRYKRRMATRATESWQSQIKPRAGVKPEVHQ